MSNIVTLKDILMQEHRNVFEVTKDYMQALRSEANQMGDNTARFVTNLHAAQIEKYRKIVLNEEMKEELSDYANKLYKYIKAGHPDMSFNFRGRIKGLVSYERKVNMLIYTAEDKIKGREISMDDYTKNMERNLDTIGMRLTVSDLPEDQLVANIYHVANRMFEYMTGWGFIPLLAPELHDVSRKTRFTSQLKADEREYYKDYIETPKKNGYSSLHIVWYWEKYNVSIEMQFRTLKKHVRSEDGTEAHSEYKKERYKTSDYDGKRIEIRNALERNRVLNEFENEHWKGIGLYGFESIEKADGTIVTDEFQGITRHFNFISTNYVGKTKHDYE